MAGWTVLKDAAGNSPFMRRQDGALVPRRFRFTVSAGLGFEQATGCGINTLIEKRQILTALVKGLYFGFRWEDKKLTETEIEGTLQNFADADGDIGDLYAQMVEALNASGVFGKPAKAEAPSEDASVTDPPQPVEEPETATVG